MDNAQEIILKMRFRLPNGEEFEAQGTREFIEHERNYFLTLIRQQQKSAQTYNSLPTTPSQNDWENHDLKASRRSDLYLWEKLLKEDEETLILRKKTKLPLQELCLILLAGARVLLKRQEYSALELAHSLKACGGQGGRLDRLLAPEIQAGRLTAQGAKRSRTYSLSQEGFAKAFVLAEKLVGENMI